MAKAVTKKKYVVTANVLNIRTRPYGPVNRIVKKGFTFQAYAMRGKNNSGWLKLETGEVINKEFVEEVFEDERE